MLPHEPLTLAAGFVVDQVIGDPPTWPHPVRWLGRLITWLEPRLRRWLPERLGGVVLLAAVVTAAGAAVAGVLLVSGWIHVALRYVVEVVLIAWGLAGRSLAVAAEEVAAAWDRADWAEARRRVSAIVGRDTDQLPPHDIARAAIESVAENTTDAVVAPLCYAALFGPVGLWVYKAVNTLDSMVGYRTERYRRFGWASARADDALNWVPARLTWLLLSAAAWAAADGRAAFRLGWRDGRKHPSPNAAWAEATMAGALGIQLGGPSTYRGVVSSKPLLGEGHGPLDAATIRRAIHLMQLAAWMALGLALLLAWGRGEIIGGGIFKRDQAPAAGGRVPPPAEHRPATAAPLLPADAPRQQPLGGARPS
ncbi:MAG: adenosylcobinamide-phosphate synthase CbiB, partial [Gemmataceae bacterium]|nr:adenosylcobinamide-phosphate synthase CbiB [Gemmataceae bacterium]MDW8264693.1 adenosylcobinamide-phosphate synthase CbiB [Gemmataceae bacterium]